MEEDTVVPLPRPGAAVEADPLLAVLREGARRMLTQAIEAEVEGDKPQKKRFAAYPIGYFHLDIAEVSTEEGKLRLFVAIDRTSKFAFARLVESAGKMEAAQFLRDLLEAVPYRVHTVLTDNGIQFTTRARDV